MRRRNTVICREGWYFLLVLAFVALSSILRNVNMLMVVSAIMLFAFLLSWRATARALRGVTLQRKISPAINAGDVLDIQLDLQSAPSRSLFSQAGSRCLEIDETIRHLLPKSQLAKKTVHLLCWYLPRGGTEKLTYRARLLERGIYRIGPTRIATGFPLGLIRHIRILDQGDRVVVFPRTGRLMPAFGRLFQQIQLGMRGDPLRQDRQTGDFHGLRDWREGDGRRMIHWRSTARRGTPLVREFEHQQHQELNLLVDLGNEGDYRDPQRCEQVIRFAATIASAFCRHGAGILRMAIVGSEVTFAGGASHPRLLDEFLTLLATAEVRPKTAHQETLPSQLFEEGMRCLCRPEDRARPTLILSPHVWEPTKVATMAGDSSGNLASGGPIRCIDTNSSNFWHFFDPAE